MESYLQKANEAGEIPGAFLVELSNALKAREGIDIELAEIILQHIVTTVPGKECLEQALTAIEALAAGRANPRKENGGA